MTAIPSSPIRVLLVDDHFIVRMGLAASLNEDDRIEVVGQAGSVAETLELVQQLEADVAILDYNLPDGNAADILATLRDNYPELRCLVLSVSTAEQDVLSAYKFGARGYLSKATERDDLLDAVLTLGSGGKYFPAAIMRKLEMGEQRMELSSREFEVLSLIVDGFSNKEIAAELNLAEITVKQHVTSMLRKLGTQDRTQAAIAAVERGLIHIDR